MAFRDDKEAMRARIQALESELEIARASAASQGDERQMQARIGALEDELRAARAEASEEQKAGEARNRLLEQELEETRQALKRAEWRAQGSGNDRDGESTADEKRAPDEREPDPPGPSAEESPLLNMGVWQGQLFMFVIVVASLVFLAWKMFAEGARWWE